MKKMLVVFIVLIFMTTACKNETISDHIETDITPESTLSVTQNPETELEDGVFPKSFSWLDYEYDVVGSPKRQYPLGACALFASTSVFESVIAIQTGELYDLSEQHFVDHVETISDAVGISPVTVLDFFQKNGVMTEEQLPYTGTKKGSFQLEGEYKLGSWGSQMLGYPLEKSIEIIKAHLTEYGPVAASLGVYNDFGDYSGGIYECDESSGINSGHWITILGWVDDESVTNGGYWICKNSWGTDWGEDGYCRIIYGDACGIDSYIFYYLDGLSSDSDNTDDEIQQEDIPAEYSLLDSGIIPPVQDQGEYKTDALFASVDLLESSIAFKYGELINLSEQYVIDNFQYWSDDEEMFPQGVWPEMILDFFVESGAAIEYDLPYTGTKNAASAQSEPEYRLLDWDKEYLETYTAEQRINIVKKSILQYGPVTTNIILYDDFIDYSGGIFEGDATDDIIFIHHITIIGWHDDENIANGGYWICKNSFGTDWGEDGFCKIAYNDACGIDNYELYYVYEAEIIS